MNVDEHVQLSEKKKKCYDKLYKNRAFDWSRPHDDK